MTMRMLIDARHREETRVAVVKGNRVEEFDFESAERKQLKGNIYLAKVTRVEPSLQAAFVDYGGNRHGFLAFSEIHPDYYQIPKEDREALLREEAEHAAAEEALRNEQDGDEDDYHSDAEGPEGEDGNFADAAEGQDDDGAQDLSDTGDDALDHDHDHGEDAPPAPKSAGGNGEDSAVENLRQKRMNLRRRYKIQDVIRRRQVLLVQVVKEERGNKGAALTTYLSLAGRYCVLMPNTSHGGGISRKISNASDRKRLKSIMADLNLPSSMGCIVRTAGLQRTKSEIKRDFDYLARLWDEVRETTLKSAAPALVHADSDLIKRAIRDIYNKDIDEVIVEGEEGFRAARNFMKLLMPGHARKVRPYSDIVPLFQRNGVEDQLAAMYNPLVQLKSGGYLVINPTEALVSIDINSGRSTREHNIEQTALSTNLEAAHEIARQLRLRDMAGLIVIDFIDMESSGNVRKVEKAMKAALADDRARIQVGRISSFGLFEMSRQRLRTGVLEASTRTCPHCEGTGLVRTASSAGLSALRMIEDEAARGRGSRICLHASQEAAFYVLNRKRAELAEIEERYGVIIEVIPDGALEGARMSVESGGPPPAYAPRLPAPIVVEDEDEDLIEDEDEEEIEAEDAEDGAEGESERPERGAGDEERGGERRRRRRRRRRGRRDEGEAGELSAAADSEEEGAEEGEDVSPEADEGEPAEAEAEAGGDETSDGEERRSRRGRRGRRGGRRRNGEAGESREIEPEQAAAEAEAVPGERGDGVVVEPSFGEPVAVAEEPAEAEAAEAVPEAVADAAAVEAPVEAEAKPRARRRPRARKADAAPAQPVEAAEAGSADAVQAEPTAEDASSAEAAAGADVPAGEAVEAAATPKPRRTRRKAAPPAEGTPEAPVAEEAPKPRRRRTKAAPVEAEAAAGEQPAEAPAEQPADTVAAEPSEPAPVDAGTAATIGEPAADDAAADEAASPPRRGWWQRTFGS